MANTAYSSGGKLWNTADNTRFAGRGLNIHTTGFSFNQADFDQWASEGVTWIRLMFYWKPFETSPGVFSTTQRDHVLTSITRATNAGIKVMICPLITDPNWSMRDNYLPAWTINAAGTGPATPVGEWNTASLFDCLVSHGEAYLKWCMDTFVVPYDNVIGMDYCNEPDRSSAGPVQRGIQRMLVWTRSRDTNGDTLWFVATNCYSSQDASNANNDWDAILDWTNVVLQMHTYFAPPSPSITGWGGGVGIRQTGSGYYWNEGGTSATWYDTANKASFALHFASWKDLAEAKGVPWGAGEIGVQHAQPGTTAAVRLAWATDIIDALEAAGASYVAGWAGAVNYSQDDWASSDGGVMRSEYLQIMTFTPTGGTPPQTGSALIYQEHVEAAISGQTTSAQVLQEFVEAAVAGQLTEAQMQQIMVEVAVPYEAEQVSSDFNVRLSGAFAQKPVLIKIGGSFVAKPRTVKVGGSFI